LVDVFSPNHLELAAFFGESLSPSASASASEGYSEKDKTKTKIEELALKFLDSGVGPSGNGLMLIRAGEHGCLLRSRALPSPVWIPTFYDPDSGSKPRKQHAKVIDPTGAGNAFLGAFAMGYLKTGGSVVEAACYGSVGASFALEQVGMPEKTEKGGEELWNGVTVFSRLREYMPRTKIDFR
jgi:sugar/nucleoside kinase (ribokinase family)